jgi:HK97 family phage prohead protease
MTLPKENLIREMSKSQIDVRSDDTGIGVLRGHFAKFNEWTEINSAWEGRFLERVAPGAFKKTLSESKDKIRVLYDHGKDPNIGNKPLGPLREVGEDDEGAYYEVPLLDTAYNRDLLPALKQGLLGASFRFSVVAEDYDQKPRRSDINPNGLPERTIREARLYELGPVTFPAYSGATASVRSGTDDAILRMLMDRPDRLKEILDRERTRREPNVTVTYGRYPEASLDVATTSGNDSTASEAERAEPTLESEPSEATTHSTIEESEPPEATTPEPGVVNTPRFNSREEWLEWISKI